MARVDLNCLCGHSFFVSDAQVGAQGTVECPACGDPVKPRPPSKAGLKSPSTKPALRPPTARFPGPRDASESPAPSRKKLILIAGGITAVVVVGIIILAVVFSSPSVDYEKEAALAVEKRKKAFEETVSKSPSGPTAKPTAPSDPAPLKPAQPPPVKATAMEPKPKVAPVPATVPAAQTPPPSAPSSQTPQTVPTAPKPSGASTPVNPDLSAKIRSEVLSLHSYYLNLILSPTEQSRMDSLISGGTNGPDDVSFLQGIVAGAKLKAVRDEIGLISQTLPTLERESQEGLPVDKLTLTDGRVLNCRVLDESADVVKVSRTVTGGVGGQMSFRRETIARLEKGKGVGADYAARWESARKGALAAQVEVLVWCKENGLLGQARLAAFTILRTDPSNTQARTEVNLPADPVKNAEDLARGGVIVYQGRSWAPRDLREKLVKDGYFLVDGQWYFKKERTIAIPNLFRYEKQTDKPLLIGANGLVCHDTDTVYRSVKEPGSSTVVEQSEVRYLRRFYAPPMVIESTPNPPPGVTPPVTTYELDIRTEYDKGTPAPGALMKGEVPLFITVGEPILEASVMTTAEVKTGGSIVVYLVTKGGEGEKRTKLYTCDPKESQSHAIPPELIRGATELNLVAVIEGTAGYTQKVERRHVRDAFREGKRVTLPALDVVHARLIPDYKAVLFPSAPSSSSDVFRLKATTGEPAASLNKLFEANPDALK